MRRHTEIRNVLLILTMLFSMALPSDTLHAQILEVFGMWQQMSGDETTADDMVLTIADHNLGGIGAGLNLGKFNLNMDLLFGKTDVSLADDEMTTDQFLFDLNLDYAFFKWPFSPMITAGFGSVTFTDSFVQFESINETDISYNLGFGFRLLAFEHFRLRAFYKSTWTTIKNTDDSIVFKGISITAGYVF